MTEIVEMPRPKGGAKTLFVELSIALILVLAVSYVAYSEHSGWKLATAKRVLPIMKMMRGEYANPDAWYLAIVNVETAPDGWQEPLRSKDECAWAWKGARCQLGADAIKSLDAAISRAETVIADASRGSINAALAAGALVQEPSGSIRKP